MQLTELGLKDRAAWMQAGYDLPQYDRAAVREKTLAAPQWIHFGAGNIFRAFQANLAQRMLNDGLMDTGIIAAEGFDYEIIEKSYRPHDNYSVLVTLKADGSIEKTVIGSVVESMILDSENADEFARLQAVFANPSLQMATFTITEKGYALKTPDGNYLPAVAADLAAGPAKPASYLGKVVALLYARFLAGAAPIAMVSTDNCSHNGEKLAAAVSAYAQAWAENGRVPREFLDYISNPAKVAFPWSMIDKITPRPADSVEKMLQGSGLEGTEAVVTSRRTYVAPFVNAEESEYLVIEDAFPNGRPALEKVGVIFTTRETVNKVERMKVCTCLNPLHTALAVYGCLLGYTSICAETNDPELAKLIQVIGYQEGLPVVTNPGVIDPKSFIDTVVKVRLPNPFMPDTPQRIATDTSQKLSIRFGETVKAYLADPALKVSDLKLIPLVYAGWLRYLMAVDDNGAAFELSPDPLTATVKPVVDAFKLGDQPTVDAVETRLHDLLANAKIFGVDLFQAALADRVSQYFIELIAGPGAIRATLKKYTA